MNQMEVPPSPSPSPPPSPLASLDRPRCFRPCRWSIRRVFAPLQNQPSHALEILAFGSKVLPFPIFNFLTEEELMYSVEPQLNKLVITHFPEALKTLVVSVISCLGQVVLLPQYKIFLDPLSALRTSSDSSQLGWNDPSSLQTPPLSLFPSPQSPSMKIATRNARGVGNDRFRLNVQHLVNAYRLDILVILEPKISGSHMEHVIG